MVSLQNDHPERRSDMIPGQSPNTPATGLGCSGSATASSEPAPTECALVLTVESLRSSSADRLVPCHLSHSEPPLEVPKEEARATDGGREGTGGSRDVRSSASSASPGLSAINAARRSRQVLGVVPSRTIDTSSITARTS